MPELPEVETIRQDLERKIAGHTIRSVIVKRSKLVRTILADFEQGLAGNTIMNFERRGKLLLITLKKGDKKNLLIHLKMTGQLIYQWNGKIIAGGHTQPPVTVNLPNRYSRIIIEFDNAAKLFFNDMRAFGYMKLVNDDEKQRVLSLYGTEPLSKEFTVKYLQTILQARKTSLKAILMNQTLIAGIGNIYADESCFAARIRPDRLAGSLKPEEIRRLRRAIQTVLKKAIIERGTTFNNYVDPDGRKGNFVRFLKVYGRGGLPCVRCRLLLQKKRLAGRGTVYCKKCQV